MIFPNYLISVEQYLLSLALAFMVSLGLAKLLIELGRFNAVGNFIRGLPHYPKEKNVMMFGGCAVVLSFLLTLWLFCLIVPAQQKNFYLLCAISLCLGSIFLLGILDDIYDYTAWVKFSVQIAVATALFFFGFKIGKIGDWILWDGLSYFLTVLWVIGLTNAVNLIDGKDGLASGVILLSCVTLFFIYFGRDIRDASFLSIVLAGSILGFFCFNFPPAKIILGDTGSLSIGFLASLITLAPVSQGFTDRIYYVIPVVALLYPILDTAFSFFRRVLEGKSPFQKDQEHFHHRLMNLGLTSRQTILVLFAVCAYFNLTSLVPIYYINLVPKFVPLFTIFTLISIFVLIFFLRHFEKNKK